MDKPLDTRYWEFTGPGPFDGVPADELIYHVYTPLFRLIAAPEFGLVAHVFMDTNGLSDERRYNAITTYGVRYMPPLLLAETHFAYGRPLRAVKILETYSNALETACSIKVTHREFDALAEFVALALAVRARKAVKNAMLEIQNGL